MPVKGARGPTAERLALANRVRLMRDEDGLLYREIVERLGISQTYAQALYSDPDGAAARARKDSYAGLCVDCGGPTCGSDGVAAAPERCKDCRATFEHVSRFWTRDTIIERFQAFHAHTGRIPTAVESQSRHGAHDLRDRLSATRLAEIDSVPAALRLPHPAVVYRELGSWGVAVRAAGFEYSGVGGSPTHRQPKGKKHMRRYVVLQKNGTGFIPKEIVEAFNPSGAIQQVASAEGTFVAVLEQHWLERKVAPKTVFAVVEETVAA